MDQDLRVVCWSAARFTIDTKGAGAGGLGLTLEGPVKLRLSAKTNSDGTCSVVYLPTEAGDYNINILMGKLISLALLLKLLSSQLLMLVKL